MRQLVPEPRDIEDPQSIYDALRFESGPRAFANMVSSADGRAQVDGKASGLGSSVDQALMQRLRAHADCVLNGAGTAARDPVYRRLDEALVARRRAAGLPDEPLWAVATASGRLPDSANVLSQPRRRPVVFVAECTPRAERERLERRASVVIAGEDRPEPKRMLRALRDDFGCDRVLIEGGPALNYSMLLAGCIDELFLTFAPKLVAGDGKTIVDGPLLPREQWRRLELISLFEHESELFLRYKVR